MKKHRLALVSFVSSLLIMALAACAPGEAMVMPPEIRYGEDVCVECNMIISDPRFAAAYVHEVSPGRYESIPFDDIGDLLIHADKHPEHTVVRWYVHDYASEEWLDATGAHFVFSNQLQTPMAQGTAAHAALESAHAMAAELDGEVLDWDGLLARHQAGGLMVQAGLDTAAGAMGTARVDGAAMAETTPVGVPEDTAMAEGAPDVMAESATPSMMHDHAAMHALHQQAGTEEVVLGEAEIDGYILQLISHGPLHAGYNDVMVHLNGPDGQPVTGARLAYQPRMTMLDGMHHASPVEQPEQVAPGMYHGAVAFSMPGGPDLGSWSLATSFEDPATGTSGEATFDVDVAPSKLHGSWMAPGDRKLFLALVAPIMPQVGRQPLELLAFEKAGMMEWPVLDDLTLEITPFMPTMGHGSPGNENPVPVGNGHYLGTVNFSMAGPWTVTVVARSGEDILGEVTFELQVP
jgi:copper chaperone NosL